MLNMFKIPLQYFGEAEGEKKTDQTETKSGIDEKKKEKNKNIIIDDIDQI